MDVEHTKDKPQQHELFSGYHTTENQRTKGGHHTHSKNTDQLQGQLSGEETWNLKTISFRV